MDDVGHVELDDLVDDGADVLDVALHLVTSLKIFHVPLNLGVYTTLSTELSFAP